MRNGVQIILQIVRFHDRARQFCVAIPFSMSKLQKSRPKSRLKSNFRWSVPWIFRPRWHQTWMHRRHRDKAVSWVEFLFTETDFVVFFSWSTNLLLPINSKFDSWQDSIPLPNYWNLLEPFHLHVRKKITVDFHSYSSTQSQPPLCRALVKVSANLWSG